MLKFSLILIVLMLSLTAQAKIVRLDCIAYVGDHSLKVTVDDKYFDISTHAPILADIQFIVDGKNYFWKSTQLIGRVLSPGSSIAYFTKDSLNELYIVHDLSYGGGDVVLNLARVKSKFMCKQLK
jgi:hypothetical protein